MSARRRGGSWVSMTWKALSLSGSRSRKMSTSLKVGFPSSPMASTRSPGLTADKATRAPLSRRTWAPAGKQPPVLAAAECSVGRRDMKALLGGVWIPSHCNPPQHSQKVPLAPRLLPLHHVMFPAPHFLCSFEPTPSPQYDLPSSLV